MWCGSSREGGVVGVTACHPPTKVQNMLFVSSMVMFVEAANPGAARSACKTSVAPVPLKRGSIFQLPRLQCPTQVWGQVDAGIIVSARIPALDPSTLADSQVKDLLTPVKTPSDMDCQLIQSPNSSQLDFPHLLAVEKLCHVYGCAPSREKSKIEIQTHCANSDPLGTLVYVGGEVIRAPGMIDPPPPVPWLDSAEARQHLKATLENYLSD
ncbi:hypothetical protein C8R44DRAFT_934100 [Mycena epipterygia]|nr:hypothetical protein C8R44DRAFT_934100 [Mycena epipterygia]